MRGIVTGSITFPPRKAYTSSDRDYYYEIVFWDGTLHQPDELYNTAHQALVIGTESIKTVIGY